MTRADFIARLRRGLAGMSPEAVDDIVADYETHFADGAADGRSEDEVAEGLGDPDRLARDLCDAAPADRWKEPGRGMRIDWRFRQRRWRGFAEAGPSGWLAMGLAVIAAIVIVPLVIVFVATLIGFVVLPIVVLALVVAAIAALFGTVGLRPWRWGFGRSVRGPPLRALGAATSRSFAWLGGDTLRVSVPADVSYAQSPTTSLSIDGPADALDCLVIERGEIRYDRWVSGADRLKIALSAPDVTAFQINGSADMSISEFRHDRLKIRIAGHGAVRANGEARSCNVGVAGRGVVDLSDLRGEAVKVSIAGSGRATIAPAEIADIGVAGSGTVTLLTDPPDLRTRIAGSGRVIHAKRGAAAPERNAS
jgi:uncharacterized membrane protein